MPETIENKDGDKATISAEAETASKARAGRWIVQEKIGEVQGQGTWDDHPGTFDSQASCEAYMRTLPPKPGAEYRPAKVYPAKKLKTVTQLTDA